MKLIIAIVAALVLAVAGYFTQAPKMENGSADKEDGTAPEERVVAQGERGSGTLFFSKITFHL